MTPKQVAMVQTSWLEVDPISDAVATLFYERLFDLDPTLRRLFRRTDMVQQRRIRRHAGYGVRENHYDKVGEALLWTLREGLGEAFTLEVREAWAEVYYTLASVMIGAASGEAAA